MNSLLSVGFPMGALAATCEEPGKNGARSRNYQNQRRVLIENQPIAVGRSIWSNLGAKL